MNPNPMYVGPTARGEGAGRVVLGALEAEARRLKVDRIVLETGERQRMRESLRVSIDCATCR